MPPIRFSSPNSRHSPYFPIRRQHLHQSLSKPGRTSVGETNPAITAAEAQEHTLIDMSSLSNHLINTQRTRMRYIEEFISDNERRHNAFHEDLLPDRSNADKALFERLSNKYDELEGKSVEVEAEALHLETQAQRLWQRAATLRTQQGDVIHSFLDGRFDVEIENYRRRQRAGTHEGTPQDPIPIE